MIDFYMGGADTPLKKEEKQQNYTNTFYNFSFFQYISKSKKYMHKIDIFI